MEKVLLELLAVILVGMVGFAIRMTIKEAAKEDRQYKPCKCCQGTGRILKK